MPIFLYNTLVKTNQEFKPLHDGKVLMYNCGPTVYSHPHIGNFRSFLFADTLRRCLEFKGFAVTQIMNITDVGHLLEDQDEGEDKMEMAARREKKDPRQIAQFYTDEFMEITGLLNCLPASKYPRATEHINEMIELIQKLIGRGYAYVVNNAVYYDITKFPGYGKLSGNPLDQLQAGARIEVHPDKKNPMDFALWKHDPKHAMQWDSPWGKGFPGWHIECSAMSAKYLGETFDIHTGGEDNIFPHHECEIAQSEGASGKKFVNYWMHVRHLLVDNEKMSKSKGNFYTIKDILNKGFSPMALRYLLTSTHYRQPLNFTLESLGAAQTAVQRLLDFRARLQEQALPAPDGQPGAETISCVIDNAITKFENAMDDDLNISEALAAVFDFMREANKLSLDKTGSARLLATFDRFNVVMGLKIEEKGLLDSEIEGLIRQRNEARKNKDFAAADKIRNDLKSKGIVIEDTPQGMRWKKI
ncbi:MAG: cysteine--tRNA ligase [Planctomycetes bacterium]|nr:cysteine--tRNA ligase [Planctomycetota bacterium]